MSAAVGTFDRVAPRRADLSPNRHQQLHRADTPLRGGYVRLPGFTALVDTGRALQLGKAAGVILDEAEMVGLGYSIRLKARQHVREDREERTLRYDHQVNVVGHEAPPQ